ncbi:MobH family relaxase [Sulfurivermis fontis]|uniref:MobH family relaxase n=1 Tax=Sulfurivermis fontis TaxID=1972068 RepID=UPI000FD8593F|nr:MobH family relaxase [Sulfurivermis fontis]
MLGRLFRRDSPRVDAPSPDGRFSIDPPEVLLAPHARVIASIRGMTGVPDTHWAALYSPLFGALARFVQQLPASEAHHHAAPGGLLRHALEVALEAMKLRRGALLPPGASAEELARLQDVWSYACVTAALLHDIGKPLADQRVTLFSPDHASIGFWSPVDGPMPPPARYYRVEFVTKRRYRRHERLAPLLAGHIVPAQGLRWLADEPEVMDAWLAALQGEYEAAGPLGAIVAKADGLSVARDLSGGGKVQLPTARTRPLSERLITALRYLLARDELPLNRRGAAGFLAGDDLWLVSKRVLDALREQLAREGQTGVPSRNDRLMDELQQHGLLIPNEDHAIWTCEVRIGDWTQRLTLLRMEASAIWSNPERRPVPLDGTVIPVAGAPEDGADADAAGETAAEPCTAAPETNRATRNAPQESAGHPAEPGSAQGYDDLPLPYDIEAPGGGTAIPSTEPSAGNRHHAGEASVGSTPQDDEDEDAGRRFVAWLKDNIASGRVEINTVNARLHVLPQGLALISPGIFRDFDSVRWDKAQKRFQKMKLHLKRPDGTNIWTCRVAKDRKQSRIKVMLIPEPESALGVKLPPPNPAVTLLTENGGETAKDSEKKVGDGQVV